jgi:primosomal protein N' (replication factor Y)
MADLAVPGARVKVRFAGQDVDGYVLARAATADHDDEMDEDHTDLVVLAAPVARTGERVDARFGDLREAPVVIRQGA